MLSGQQQSEKHNLLDYCDSKLLTIPSHTLLAEAIALMSQNRHSCLLITSGEQIEGIFTERDLVRLIALGMDFSLVTIAEVMTHQPLTISLADRLNPAAIFSLFKQHRIRHLPVVNAGGKAIGVVTPTSLRRGIKGGYLLKHRLVGEVMQPQVIQAKGDRSIADMAQLMAEHRVSFVVITARSFQSPVKAIGVVTERDLVQFKALNLDLHHLPVREVMSSPLLPLHADDNLQSAHDLMSQYHIRRLVVCDSQGYLQGIITQTNILQNLDSQEIQSVMEFLENLIEHKNQQLEVRNKIEQRYRKQIELKQFCFESLLAAIPHLVLIVNPQKDTVAAIAKNSHPINSRKSNLIEQTIAQFQQPATRQQFYAPAQQALDSNQTVNFNYSITLASGEQLKFAAQVKPLPNQTAIWIAHPLSQGEQSQTTELLQRADATTRELDTAVQLFQTQITDLFNHLPHQGKETPPIKSWLGFLFLQLVPFRNSLEKWLVRLQRSPLPSWTGGMITLFLALQIEIYRRNGIILPIPFIQLIIAISISANLGGVVSGLWAYSVWVVFVIYAAIVSFGPATLTGGTIQVLIGIFIMGIFTLIQGWTKEQNRRLTSSMLQLNTKLEQEVRLRTRKLANAYANLKQEMQDNLASKQALAESEQKFRAIFEHAGIGIAMTSLDKKLLQVNPHFCQFLGYSATELQSMTFEQITHPDERQGDHESVQKMRSKELSVLKKEKRYLHKDGSTIWGSLTAVTVKDATQKPLHFVSVIEDITKRKQAELALLESEVHFVNLLNACPFLVWTSGTDGLCNFLNTAWLDFTGRALELELGNGWVEGVHPEDLDFCVNTYQTAFARRERFQMEYRLRRRNGEYGWIYDEGMPKFKIDGSFGGYIGTCVDIDARVKFGQQREQLLQQVDSERLFLQSVLKQMPAGVVIAEAPTGKFILRNEEVETILRHEIPTVDGVKEYSQFGYLTSEGTPQPASNYPLAKALDGEVTQGAEIDYLCGDNKIRTLLVNAAPIRNHQGAIKAAIGTFFDVTELKQAEAAKKDAENKSVLLKEIHHRIKNNLQIVSALLDLQTEQIKDRASQLLLEKSQARIHTIALIHEKLYSTRRLDRVDFSEYLNSLCSYIRDSFIYDHQQIDLLVNIEPTLLNLDVAIPCGLIINELVVNSLEHAFVDRLTGKIEIEFKKHDRNYYYLCIRDDGCGFDLDLAEISDNTQFLGLSLVISLVEKQLYGTWEVKQSPGFVIEIKFPSIK